MSDVGDSELVDDAAGLVLRRVVVGPLRTNCWIVHPLGDREAIVMDPGDEPGRILDACAGLRITAVALTHSHWDHVFALPELIDAWGVDVLMHPQDQPVWPHELAHLREHGHFSAGTATAELLAAGARLSPPPDRPLWDGHTRPLRDGQRLPLGALEVRVRHTPGHTPGGVCLHLPGHVLSGDTLFPGGAGLTGPPLSDFPTIMDSVERTLFTLPDDLRVHPGHGHSTTIAAERPHLPEWRRRGW